MRIFRVGVCLVAFACSSCGGGNAIERNNQLQANYGAYGQPAGYYPGRAEPFGGNAADYQAWLTQNQSGIADIQNQIAQIKEGARPPGCIGEDKYTCVASLAQNLAVADEWSLKGFNIFPENKYDVNGRLIGGSKISFYGYPPNAKSDYPSQYTVNRTHFELALGPDGSVSKLIADFSKDPTLAQTQDEYDATGLYEIAWAVIAKKCPAIDKSEVARWFQNIIKPTQQVGPRQSLPEPLRGHARDVLAKKSSLCGRSFDFHAAYGSYSQGFQQVDFGGMTLTVQ